MSDNRHARAGDEPWMASEKRTRSNKIVSLTISQYYIPFSHLMIKSDILLPILFVFVQWAAEPGELLAELRRSGYPRVDAIHV
jgi:hypothetical protein